MYLLLIKLLLVLIFRCDVSKREDVVELASKVVKEVGDVSVLVNNAGIMPCHPFTMSSSDEIKKIFDINVFAHFWVSSYVTYTGVGWSSDFLLSFFILRHGLSAKKI